MHGSTNFAGTWLSQYRDSVGKTEEHRNICERQFDSDVMI